MDLFSETTDANFTSAASGAKPLTVTQFNTVIRRIFVAEEMLRNIAILGEVSGFKISGGHAYFKIKDEGAALDCSCFNCSKTYRPKDGEQVIVFGSPDYYVKGGRFSFVVNKIEPYGLGALYLRIEELKQKLIQEGLFAAEHKKLIPTFCSDICVVTSKTGAVIRDICTTIRLKNPAINITVKDVKVQGLGAEKEIAAALSAVDKLNYDCVILARGGGSLEDLMPFNSELIARSIYAMKTPIISAVGHETDFSISDFVADLRAATPTAAAEAVAYDYYAVVGSIIDGINRANKAINNNISSKISQTKLLTSSLTRGLQMMYDKNLRRTLAASEKLKNSINVLLLDKQHKFEKTLNSLDNLSPIRILKSGYFRLYEGVTPIMSVKQVKIGQNITAKGSDGKITATVVSVEEDKQ